MINVVKKILNSAKKAYKESVILDNDVLEEELLTIITNSQNLLTQMEKEQELQEQKITQKDKTQQQFDEVERVFRRVPMWLEKPHQYNSKILSTFMAISKNNQIPVSIELLERSLGFHDSRKFLSHYNGMKNISAKNHGKVFEEEQGHIRLWEPVAEFIVYLFSQNS